MQSNEPVRRLMKLDAFLPRKGQSAIEYLNQHVRLETLLQRPSVTIGVNDTVEHAASVMASRGIHASPTAGYRSRSNNGVRRSECGTRRPVVGAGRECAAGKHLTGAAT